MSIHMIGIDHTTADVDTRAIFAFTKKRSEEIMREWLELPGIYGAIVLSTCNGNESQRFLIGAVLTDEE